MNKGFKLFVGLICLCNVFSAKAENTVAINESKIFMSPKCFTSPTDAKVNGFAAGTAILGAIAQPLISGLVDLGTSSIKNAAADKSVTFPAAGPQTEKFYTISSLGNEIVNPNIRCVTLISGNLSAKTQSNSDLPPPAWLNNALQKIIDYDNGRLVGNVALFFEAEIVRSDDKKYFSLLPRAIYVGDFLQSSMWNKERNFEIKLEFQDISSTTPYANFVFNYSGVAKGFARADCKLIEKAEGCESTGLGTTSTWFQMQPQTDEMKKNQMARKSFAAKLGLLSTPIGNVGAREINVNADGVQTTAHKIYCEKLEKNKASQFKSEETCPPDLYISRVETNYQTALLNARLDYVDAVMLYQQTCMSASADENQTKKSEAELAALRETYYRKFPQGIQIVTEGRKGNALEKGLDEETDILNCLGNKFGDTPIGQFMISGNIKETKLGSSFAKWLSPVVESSAPEIKTTLQNQLIPAKRKAIEEQEQALIASKLAATREAKFAILVADNAVSIAEIDLSAAQAKGDPVEIKKSELVLLQKKYAANNAYRAAGIPIPFSDVP